MGQSRLIPCLVLGFCLTGLGVFSWASQVQARKFLLLSGGGFAKRSFSQYSGAIVPLTADDNAFSNDGPFLRLWQKSYAFSYTTDLSPLGPAAARIDALGASLTGEIGYQKNLTNGRLAGFAGLTYRRFELSPNDPGADLNKHPTGIPLTIDAEWSPFSRFTATTNLLYTLLHDDYWAQLKLGYNVFSSIKVGPEIVLQGGEKYRYMRYGAFISGIDLGKVYLSANIGLRDDLRENEKSFYGDLHVSFFY